MSELAFCKTFLGAIDSRPIKLSSDYVSDARTYPATGVPILPRLPTGHPQRPAPRASQDAASSTASITLKPMKPSTPTLPLPGTDASKTSVYDLKSHYASATGIPASKIKILYKKKPVADSKLVSEIVGADAGTDLEFGVMIMGGATAVTPAESPAATPAAAAPSESDKGLAGADAAADTAASGGATVVGPSGKDVVATEAFWGDLNNFMLQRIKDENESERLVGVFRKAWESDR
ncbi:uncharacterized protein M421DRAFT_415756 [Didymella exigua CBS 183.55]|uniref:Ubiquitin-like domain-containing protein n=1 Tax=Didymella exigua CBS 183.55 TaxID=1150837 RepID=A0A6A5S1T7_9PLEO|nr:uncharacterized protein M421DRAFT_415756 [Didymella exigua CBS 183.55]KAF1933414.1 hypothetical protein M421DRAFT_415756 [Didymella exigua CBS 183.55]